MPSVAQNHGITDLARSRLWQQRALLAAILVVAGVLRIGRLGAQPFWHDEVLTITSTRVPVSHVFASVRNSENSPPGYFFIANVWAKLTPENEFWLRLPSALFGIASVAVLFALGRDLLDARIGLTAAALLALSPFHIAYSEEARAYALMFLLMALSTWAFVRMLRNRSRAAQTAYVLCAAAALYAHTFSIFLIAALNLYFLLLLSLRRRTGVTVRRWLTLQGAVILLFSGWIAATLEVARMGLPWMLRPARFDEAMLQYAGGWHALMVLTAMCMMATVMAIALAICKGDERLALPLLIATVPVAGPIVYGIFTPRYGIGALIGLAMLVAYVASRTGRWLCVITILLAAMQWWTSSSLGRPEYPGATNKPDTRAAAQYIIAHGTRGDPVIDQTNTLAYRALAYYLDDSGYRVVDSANERPTARIWVATDPGAAPKGFGDVTAARFRFDGLDLLEISPNPPVSQPASEPVATPGR